MAKSNGAHESSALPDGWNQWPGINDAARMLGDVPHTFVAQKIREGVIGTCIDPTGKRRLNPQDIEALKPELATLDELEIRGGRRDVTPDGFRAGTELVKQVHAHHEKMVPLITTGYERVLSALETRCGKLSEDLEKRDAYIAKLLDERDENARKREEMLSEEHARALTFRTVEASEKRKDRALEILGSKLGPLVLAKLGMNDPKMQIGTELLGTIRRDQLLMLVAFPGMVDDTQKSLIMKLLGTLSPEEQAALDAQKTEEKKP